MFRRLNKLVVFSLFLSLGSFLILVILVNIPQQITFNISVNTELISIKSKDTLNPRIPLHNMELYTSKFDTTPKINNFNGSIEVSENSTITVERILNGPISIIISREDTLSVGVLFDEFDNLSPTKLKNFVEFYSSVPNDKFGRNQNIIIPIFGQVTLGRTVYYETYNSPTSLMKSGEIKMISPTFFGGRFFESGKFELNIGDQFFTESIGKKGSKAYGFIAINNQKPGMIATYRVVGKKGYISIAGPKDKEHKYFISSTIMSKFLNDPLFKVIGWFSTFMIFSSALINVINGIKSTKNE